MLGSLGMPELIVIFVIVVLIFGPKQLPRLGRMFTDTVREVRQAGKELDGPSDET